MTQVRDDIYLVDVVVRARRTTNASRSRRCAPCRCALPGGRSVPLSQFVTFSYAQDPPLIWRRDRVPTLDRRADVTAGHPAGDRRLRARAGDRGAARTLPPSYSIAVGGTVEESAKSQASVIAVVPVMLLIMFTVLMAQLRSFKLLAVVLSIAPLGLIGVVGALLLSGKPLGFVALLGILALIGIITKNAVILVGQIEAERASGKSVAEAALDASSTRFRPIMLTAVSTVLGMIPIAPTVFWGPMAFAIMGGLLVATVLTLILLPMLYVTVFGELACPAANKTKAGCGSRCGSSLAMIDARYPASDDPRRAPRESCVAAVDPVVLADRRAGIEAPPPGAGAPFRCSPSRRASSPTTSSSAARSRPRRTSRSPFASAGVSSSGR